ncbi:MAG: UDP-N-acetylglucosamine 1-carboxyvinyltransferase, partial [Hallerella sp.]|nr:UDP-N-acetylglucosamine 1-carboxyvinyltransferase [Hallerella sp.]
MDYFSISPAEKPLCGEVEISGAKNAVLATMTAAMLADGVTTITNVPYLRDTKTMSNVLRVIGCRI